MVRIVECMKLSRMVVWISRSVSASILAVASSRTECEESKQQTRQTNVRTDSSQTQRHSTYLESWLLAAKLLQCTEAGVDRERCCRRCLRSGRSVGQAWHGQPLLKVAGPMEYFEWRGEDAVTNAAPNESSVTSLFDELTNRSSSPYAEKH